MTDPKPSSSGFVTVNGFKLAPRGHRRAAGELRTDDSDARIRKLAAARADEASAPTERDPRFRAAAVAFDSVELDV